MAELNPDKIPADMKAIPNWVLWKAVKRNGKPTKVPFQTSGAEAESTNPATWTTFGAALERFNQGGYDGIGFVFKEGGGYVGIDLDGALELRKGKVEDWAREIIQKLDSYAEISPSKTGVKIFVKGKSPIDTGKNLKLPYRTIGGKEAGIEMYDHARYFAVTGWKTKGPATPQERDLTWLKERFWPDSNFNAGDFYGDDAVIERARKYLAKLPPAISGQNGHGAAFHAACMLVLGFGLTRETSLVLMREFNQTCNPPWSEHELVHKVQSASKQAGPRNYLRNIQPAKWSTIQLPKYEAPAEKRQPKITKLVDAAEKYMDRLVNGGANLIETGISDLDAGLGGGFAKGEFVIVAGRPSHGKTAVALQWLHHWTLNMPGLFVSEEMSAIALGKRALQYVIGVPQEHWAGDEVIVREQMAMYAAERRTCYIAEECGSAVAVVEQIEKAVKELGVQVVVVDYVQLLSAKGSGEFERVTESSKLLRAATKRLDILTIGLAHLSRTIEHRKQFIPTMADLKQSGQLEQDADVIISQVWPWRLNDTEAKQKFLFYVLKNRERGIMAPIVEAKFMPMRQAFSNADRLKYNEFEQFDGRAAAANNF